MSRWIFFPQVGIPRPMIYAIAPLFLLISIVLLRIGLRKNEPWALFAMKACWGIVLAVSSYLTYKAWQGQAYGGENWDMVGIIFIVWPITLLIVLLTAIEFFKLKSRQDQHAKTFRLLAIIISILMIALSLSGLFMEGW